MSKSVLMEYSCFLSKLQKRVLPWMYLGHFRPAELQNHAR